MADNITLNAGSGGSALAADDIASVFYQRVKITYGADGTANDVTSTATNPLPVALSDTDNAVLDNIDTNTTNIPNVIGTDGAAGPTNALSIAGTESGGNLQELLVDSDGHLQVDVLSIVQGGTHVDDAAFTVGSDDGVPSFGMYDATPDNVDDGDAGIMRMTQDRRQIVVNEPQTSGGISTVYRDEDIDETAVAAKASAGQVYWIHCINLDATPVYLHFYDVAQGSVTVGTTGELMSFAVPSQGDANGAGFTMEFSHGVEFGTAITIACTTTIGGSAGPAANEVILNVGYA